MRKIWEKIAVCGLVATLTITSLSIGSIIDSKASAADAASKVGSSIPYGSSTKAVDVPDNPNTFHDYDASEIIQEMGIGWNLGNTMDGHSDCLPSETAWQSDITTKEMIKSVHDMGFNTIRIPVTWGKMINEDYSINEVWMSRVEDIVNYAIDENMYVMINLYHDGSDFGTSGHGWLDLNDDDEFINVREKFDGVWKTIAERFKNYDEHLLFAAMNEVYGGAVWSGNVAQYQSDYKKINVLNQDFVDIVRAIGSNNDKRWIVVQARDADFSTVLDNTYGFVMPTDSVNRVMLEGHDYDGWDISASTADHTPKSARESEANSYANLFKKLKELYVDNGIPVVVGEWGFAGKSTASRSYAYEGVAYLLKKYKLTGCIWDNNEFEFSTYTNNNFGLIDRKNLTAKDSNILNEVMRGYYYDTSTADLTYRITAIDGEQNVSKNIGLTSFNVSTSDLTLKAGENCTVTVSDCEPADSDDVVLWKSDNGRIASVSDGKIIARAIGTTIITAYAQTGEVRKTIKVNVKKQDVTDASTEIKTNYDSYVIEENGEAFLDGVIMPKENGAYITYASSNTDLVTVTSTGKFLSVGGKGDAVITATTSDGFVKEISVSVVGLPIQPTIQPSIRPTIQPSAEPSIQPSAESSIQPSAEPSIQPSAEPSIQPSTEPSIQPTVTPVATSTSTLVAKDTVETLTVAKKAVVVAPNKSVSVAYQSAVIPTVSTSNKKVVTAKVNNGKLVISAPKNAVRGAGTVVTVKAGSKTEKIKVSIENKVTKIKATKAKVTGKKKSTVKLTWNLTAQNKKKATTDTVKATVKKSGIVQVTNVKMTNGKAVLTVKTKKAGKTVILLKVGKKTARTMLIVK